MFQFCSFNVPTVISFTESYRKWMLDFPIMSIVMCHYVMKCLQQRSCRCVCQHVDRGIPLRSLFQPLHFTCSSFEDVWIWHTYIFPFNRNLASLWTLWDHSCSFIYLQGSVAPLTEEISWYGSGRSNVGKSRPRGEACGGQDGPTDDEPTWRRMGLAGRRCLFHCNHLHPCCNQVILRVCVCVCPFDNAELN